MSQNLNCQKIQGLKMSYSRQPKTAFFPRQTILEKERNLKDKFYLSKRVVFRPRYLCDTRRARRARYSLHQAKKPQETLNTAVNLLNSSKFWFLFTFASPTSNPQLLLYFIFLFILFFLFIFFSFFFFFFFRLFVFWLDFKFLMAIKNIVLMIIRINIIVSSNNYLSEKDKLS